MQNNKNNFSPEEAMALAKTPAGQQLIKILQKTNQAAVQDAIHQASAGNMEQVKQTLEPLLASPEIQKLLRQLGGK